MKRIMSAILAGWMLLTAFAVSLSAEEEKNDSGVSPDDYLVVHYDFEGETEEEQLSDKAPAGVSKENLTIFSTETDGKQDTYIKNGVAHISSHANNYLISNFIPAEEDEGGEVQPAADDSASGDADDETEMPKMGTDVAEFGGKMTIMAVFQASGAATGYADPFDVNHRLRFILKKDKSVEVRTGETYDYKELYRLDSVKDGVVIPNEDTVYCAFTIEYDAPTKKLTLATYLSFDGGAHYAQTVKSFDATEEDPFSVCDYLMLGKLGTVTHLDRGLSYDIDDFRIYNTVLSADEIKAVYHKAKPDPEPTPGENENPGTPVDPNPDKPNPPEDQKPSPTDPEPTGEVTVTDQTNNGKKGGCTSSVSASLLVTLCTLCAAGGLAIRKKKQ